MIIRVFRAQLKPEARAAFERLCRAVSLPLMRAQEGCLAVSIGEPIAQRPAEIVVVSVWRDPDALRAFVGERWREATILPGEADLLEIADVEHYDDSYHSLIEFWATTAAAMKRRETAALAVSLTNAQTDVATSARAGSRARPPGANALASLLPRRRWSHPAACPALVDPCARTGYTK